MWLLDVNLPNGLARLLHGYGIPCDTTARRDWRDHREMGMASWLEKAEAKLAGR